MVAENADRLRARIGELENEMSNRGSVKGVSSTVSGDGKNDAGSRLDESSEERAEVMNGLLKELRAELIHKEEVCSECSACGVMALQLQLLMLLE